MIIDGKKLAEELNQTLTEKIAQLPFQPVLCDIVVGDDPVTARYVAAKQKTAEKLGLKFIEATVSADSTTEDVIAKIQEVESLTSGLCGLIVQLPLPATIDTTAVLDSVNPRLDVDCLGGANSDALYNGTPNIIPPTAGAILHILDSLPLSKDNLRYAVVGQGALVGRPITALLKARGYDVATADSSTEDVSSVTGSADVVITGVGKPGLITGDMIREGAVVIDAGTSESGGSVAGDVDFSTVEPKASYITPVPGGVGPVTVAKLLENVVEGAGR